MNEVLKNRLVGAAALIAVGILIPVGLVWWAQPDDSLDDGSVRVYEINEQGEAVPVEETADSDQKTAPAGASPSPDESADSGATQEPDRTAPGVADTEPSADPKSAGAQTQANTPAEPVATPEPEPASGSERKSEPKAPQTGTDDGTESRDDETPAPTETAGESRPEKGWVVQIGSFSKVDNARSMKNEVADDYPVSIASGTVSGTQYHRVRIGPYASEQAAQETARQLDGAGYTTQVQQTEP